jgi:hypothetical protein
MTEDRNMPKDIAIPILAAVVGCMIGAMLWHDKQGWNIWTGWF